MNFSKALDAMAKNNLVRRKKWGGLSLILVVGKEIKLQQTTMFTVTYQGNWLPTNDDLFADDWEIIDG